MTRSSLWFVVPAHGRVELARVCLRQLARTCAALTVRGIDATAVVVADDENLDSAADLGFYGVERDNSQLGTKFNDGYEQACREGVDFVVPCGSDDWVDPDWILARELPRDAIRCARQCAFVNETGDTIGYHRTPYDGGVGIRVIPTWMLVPFDGRPAVEDRNNVIDATTLVRMKRGLRSLLRLEYHEIHPAQIVDWKSPGEQLTPWRALQYMADGGDPFVELAGVFPTEALDEMRSVYAGVPA